MRQLLNKTRLFPALIFIVSPLLFYLNGCSNTNYEGGKLPKSFSWAYGSWIIEEVSAEQKKLGNYKDNYSCVIGKDYIQLLNNNILEHYAFPYVELMPKSDYSVSYVYPSENNDYNSEDNGTTYPSALVPDDNNIILCYEGGFGYEAFLYLNRNNRTISAYDSKDFEKQGIINKTRRNKKKVPKAAIAEYESIKSSCPIVGDWQNVRDRRDKETIEADRFMNSFVLKKDGTWVDYFGDYEYSYDATNDRIKRTYPDSDTDTPVIETFKRYDAEQERIDELKRILTSKAFSYMENNVYSNTTVVHEYRFSSNGGGYSALYEVQPFGRRQISNSPITWEIVGDEVQVKDKELSGYSSFVVKQGLFGNHIEEKLSGHVYD